MGSVTAMGLVATMGFVTIMGSDVLGGMRVLIGYGLGLPPDCSVARGSGTNAIPPGPSPFHARGGERHPVMYGDENYPGVASGGRGL